MIETLVSSFLGRDILQNPCAVVSILWIIYLDCKMAGVQQMLFPFTSIYFPHFWDNDRTDRVEIRELDFH